MSKTIVTTIFLLASTIGFAQKNTTPQKKEKIWVYDVNIIKDELGKTLKIEKITFCKGTPGGAIQIRYFQTKAKLDAAGNVMYSTRERLGDNNVDPEIIRQYGN